MSGTISLSKSLRTDKVIPDAGLGIQGMRLFDANIEREIPQYTVDTYGRVTQITAGLPFQGTQSGGVLSPQYMIQTENYLRPDYSTYLDVPQGVLKGGVSEYQRPTYDTMFGSSVQGRQNFGVFDINKQYQGMPFPANAFNPTSDKDFALQQAYLSERAQSKFRDRMYLNALSGSGM